MIKIKIGQLSQPTLAMAFGKLAGAQLPPKTAYAVKKLLDKVNENLKKTREEYIETVAKKFAELDAKGDIVTDNTPWGFKLAEGKTQEDFDKAYNEFHDQEVTIDREPLTYAQLGNVQVSANELSALDIFLVDLESQPEEEETTNVAHIRR